MACAGVTLTNAVATPIGRACRTPAGYTRRGDLDFRGHAGVTKEAHFGSAESGCASSREHSLRASDVFAISLLDSTPSTESLLLW
jgi:hypothetical protein